MTALTLGSLFSGFGGLDLAVEGHYGAETVWQVELDPHASTVLAAHWDAPNLGDITTVDWARVEPVDVLCGGFPCQDISSAGLGAGIKEGTRSGLWYRFADAVRVLRPRLVVVENVSALLVRGLDIVVGDLAALGYDAEWMCLRASDIGAPHRRERVFLTARDTASGGDGEWAVLHGRGEVQAGGAGGATSHTHVLAGWTEGDAERGDGTAADGGRGSALLGRRRGAPTDSDDGADDWERPRTEPRPGGATDWGPYTGAIRRWERLTRTAPAPTDGQGRLSPWFVEWMMGLPEGWVCDHLVRRPALRALGNGVVPQQAASALAALHAEMEKAS